MDTVTELNLSLFGGSLEDVQLGFRSQASGTRFGRLARRFFADLFGRTLRAAIDRELPNHVGPSEAIKNVAESAALAERVDAYARDSAGVMEQFAEDWYASRNWPERRPITREEAQAFVAHAVEKLRSELALASGHT
jgi:hypothetical protein